MSSSLTIALETIGPNDARDLLEANNHNRNIRPGRVEQYKRDMRAGHWLPTGEPIQVGIDGTVLNGQHRLLAVIEAGMNITFPVMRNVPAEHQAVADTGLARRLSDVLKLQYGETNVVALAAAVRQVHFYRAVGRLGTSNGKVWGIQPSVSELTDTYLAEPGLKDSLTWGQAINDSDIWTPRALGAALHYAFKEVDPEEADPYFRLASTGEMLAATDPIFVLRRNLGKRTSRARFDATFVAALHVKAFNYWRQGRQVKMLSWHPGGSHAEQFPRILTAGEIAGDDEVDEVATDAEEES